MPPRLRKVVLAIHLTSSLGWFGGALAYVALVVVVLSSDDGRSVRDAILVMNSVDWFLLLPFAYIALLTGLVMSLATPWGLLRHWWILFSLVLTLFAVFVLTEYSLTLRGMAAVAVKPTLSAADLARLKDPGHAVHTLGGLALLFTVAVLNVLKPQGLTRYGWRKQQERRRQAWQQRKQAAPSQP